MKFELLIPTVDNDDILGLVKKMNIQTDTIICNQNSKYSYSEFVYKENKVKNYSFDERGVGLNRNNGLMRTNSDYCIISDDDLVFVTGYDQILDKVVKKYPDADIILFNLIEDKITRFVTKKDFRVNRFNYMRFGAARFVLKTEKIRKNNIYFNLNFGGGTQYSAGEDTLFLKECLDKKLKIVAVTESLAELTDDRESTWFKGYNSKYFRDRGALFYALSNKLYILLCIQFLLRHKNLYKSTMTLKQAYKTMVKGARGIKNEKYS